MKFAEKIIISIPIVFFNETTFYNYKRLKTEIYLSDKK
jgi:hypothetical protein